MPYKSDAQRRFFHTDTAKKAGITSSDVEEFDKASKGKKLPEKVQHKAEGGEVKEPPVVDPKASEDMKEGFRNGIQGDWEKIKSFINQAHENYTKGMGDTGNLKGLQHVADEKVKGMAYGGETNPKHETLTAMQNNPTAGFADGGDVTGATSEALGQMFNPFMMPGVAQSAANVAQTPGMAGVVNAALDTNVQGPLPTPPPQVDQDFINKLNAGTAMTPPFQVKGVQSPVTTGLPNLKAVPSTPPSIYSGIGAPDRAALAQQILKQQSSPESLVAKGAGGLADAITSAFGKQPTNFQQNIRENQQNVGQQQLNVMDVERQQKLQDIQANIAVQEADPNSPYSTGMRQFLNAQGMKVPSGMSASMMKQTLPDVTKIFDAKMQSLTAQGAQGVEAGKALLGETLTDWLREQFEPGAEKGEEYLAGRVGGGTTNASFIHSTPSGIRYSVK